MSVKDIMKGDNSTTYTPLMALINVCFVAFSRPVGKKWIFKKKLN